MDFWELNALSAANLGENFYSQPSPFLSLSSSFMARSNEGKKWVYMLARRVPLSLEACALKTPGLLNAFA
ncbi:hypothetical protein Pyn_29643 [Prunus yedoensis var. nudiflora]|uniref:Uncharacterized protein n=1 Tax=Prunus yedoensis var. nudiflora TaxID=2094558 RepID=A0A314Y8G9_PRUYE|nr:hypothetical protein Pyn_29643 [Prunus yedoensis var. nudiflora]